MTRYEPHPYALLLPSLTDDEYKALKADIKAHGILYPIILDEDDRVLDGVHRERIASELGIDPPVSRHIGLDNDRKLHLAVGLNMRRRHLDADRRRELVRRLHDEESMSVRAIASVTGWSKSTVDRDLKASPFEHVLADAVAAQQKVLSQMGQNENESFREFVELVGEIMTGRVEWADQEWKRGNWPPADSVAYMKMAYKSYMTLKELSRGLLTLTGADPEPDPVTLAEFEQLTASWTDEKWVWAAERLRDHGLLDAMMGLPRVDAGIDHGDDCPSCHPVSQMGQAS